MADREITLGGSVTYYKPTPPKAGSTNQKQLAVGDKLRGRFVGVIEGKFGISYKLQQADGNVVAVNKSGKLNKLMEQVPLQSEITIEYGGKSPMEKGEYAGTESHQYKVTVHDGAPAAAAPTSAPSALPF